MRPTRRSFVVEYKSSRRRPTHQPNTIWGNTDLKTLAREAEADAPHLFTAAPAPLPAEKIRPAPSETTTDAPAIAADASRSVEDAVPQPASPAEAVSTLGAAQALSKEPPRRRLKHQIAKTVSPATTDSRKAPVRAADPVAELYQNDDLDRLEAENQRLKTLMAAQLRHENDRMRAMLARFH